MFNQLTKSTMSKTEMIALRAMQTWTVCLAGIAIIGIVVVIVNVVIGNISSTTAFEF